MEYQRRLPKSERDEQLTDIVSKLPPLPSRLTYFDDFSEIRRTISQFNELDTFDLHYNGTRFQLVFRKFAEPIRTLLKHAFLRNVGRGVMVHTAAQQVSSVSLLDVNDACLIATSTPQTITLLWTKLLSLGHPPSTYAGSKSILSVLCDYRISGWSPDYVEFLSKSLALPPYDKYAAIRSGDAFLTAEQEARVVELLDESAVSVAANADEWPSQKLADLAMLTCAFQFGMRPSQIARLKVGDAKIRNGLDANEGSIHLSFAMVKQRSSKSTLRLVRRVKPEWCIFFKELLLRSSRDGLPLNSRLLLARSAPEVGSRIATAARALLNDDSVTAYHFRHSAAQRMVDAGASHEELASFLGHSDLRSGLVYFQSSDSQAERINRALGISETYSTVARIARDRFISSGELARLKGEQQIAGVPFGAPIAGIGGCASGQPACPYNPVLSCYTCRRFMPIREAPIHIEVLANLREIVAKFIESSRTETASPAYLQLQRAIAGVKAVLAEIGGVRT